MCGFFGVVNLTKIKERDFCDSLDLISHRGPDDEGYLFYNIINKKIDNKVSSNYYHIGLGFRRLSIIDLTSKGHQPMGDKNKKVWIVFNGEIYNYLEIKNELKNKGYSFYSHSDTEVIINSYLEWGYECTKKFNGMWAFVILDFRKNIIFTSRDRFGIKPLYYYLKNKEFIFASEIKSILHYKGFNIQPEDDTIFNFLLYGLVDYSDKTLFKNIYQVKPSHSLVLKFNKTDIVKTRSIKYWDININKKILIGNKDEIYENFFYLFKDSIKLRLRSDVEVGSCLSGGLDSSSIVSIADSLLNKKKGNSLKLKTFSSCFNDLKYDERIYIKEVLKNKNLKGYNVFPKPVNLFDKMNRVIWHQDIPFGSTSIYAQWNVFQLIHSKKIKVVLDGQGGDEVLVGYRNFWPYYFIDLMKNFQLIKLYHNLAAFNNINKLNNNDTLQSMTLLMPGPIRQMFKNLFINKNFLNKDLLKKFKIKRFKLSKSNSLLDSVLYDYLFKIHLPGLLHYEDRNSMAFSVESRVPFLDYRLVEYMFGLPNEYKLEKGMSKYILRKSMDGILSEKIRMRFDKMGFVTPEEIWLKNHLKGDILDIINSGFIKDIKYFDIKKLKCLFNDFFNGRLKFDFLYWRIICFILWYKIFFKDGYKKLI